MFSVGMERRRRRLGDGRRTMANNQLQEPHDHLASRWSRGRRQSPYIYLSSSSSSTDSCSHRIKTLILTFGPIILPRLIAYYRSIRSSAGATHAPVRPIPPGTKWALNILFSSALVGLITSTRFGQPDDLFRLTGSRLHTPTELLFRRLASLRPITHDLEILKTKFASVDSRLRYLALGPESLIHCQFCHADEPNSYLWYSIPAILFPHLLHVGVLGLITSPLLFGLEPARWRTQATIAGTVLATIELYLRASHDVNRNAVAARAGVLELDSFYWKVLTYRGIAMAVVDLVLGWMIYLSSTNRAFVSPPSVTDRLRHSTQLLDSANRKLHALAITRMAIAQDEGLLSTLQRYWNQEYTVSRQIYDDPNVVKHVKAARASLDLSALTQEATLYADAVVSGAIQGLRASHSSSASPSSPIHP